MFGYDLTLVRGLTVVQGTAHLLLGSELVPVSRPRRPVVDGVLGRFLSCVDRRSRCYSSNQASRWEGVCSNYFVRHCMLSYTNLMNQLLLPVNLHYRLHPLPHGHCCSPQCAGPSHSCQDTGLSCSCGMVVGCGSEHPGRLGYCSQPGRYCGVPALHVLYRHWMPLFH